MKDSCDIIKELAEENLKKSKKYRYEQPTMTLANVADPVIIKLTEKQHSKGCTIIFQAVHHIGEAHTMYISFIMFIV